MVLFPKEGTDITTYFSGQEYVDMKDGDAVFIAIPYTSDRTPAPGAKESIVPISPLTSDNPARDFRIGVREEVVLVLDCYGNLSSVGMKFTRKPSAKELKDVIAQMPKKIDTLNKKLEKDLKSVTTALEKGDRIKAFKDAVKILESGVVGYNASAEAAKVYNDICDQVRAEIAELKGADPKEAQSKLNELGNVFTKKAAPGIAAEIASAKKDVVVVAK